MDNSKKGVSKKRAAKGDNEEVDMKVKKHTEEGNIEETKGETLDFEDEFADEYGMINISKN